jgi:hypothetical protein
LVEHVREAVGPGEQERPADPELLRAYADGRDELAFAALERLPEPPF